MLLLATVSHAYKRSQLLLLLLPSTQQHIIIVNISINDDRSQPFRECARCGAVTTQWKFYKIVRRGEKGEKLKVEIILDEPYFCLPCAEIAEKQAAKLERKRMREEMR